MEKQVYYIFESHTEPRRFGKSKRVFLGIENGSGDPGNPNTAIASDAFSLGTRLVQLAGWGTQLEVELTSAKVGVLYEGTRYPEPGVLNESDLINLKSGLEVGMVNEIKRFGDTRVVDNPFAAPVTISGELDV